MPLKKRSNGTGLQNADWSLRISRYCRTKPRAILWSPSSPLREWSARGRWSNHCRCSARVTFGLAGSIPGGGFIAERSFRQADRIRVNDRIRAREIRVVDEDGGQLGVMPPFEAIKLARERGLDLVEISPTADPPVCKITDYGKYLYQTNKKAHEQRKHQKGSQLKEVKFRPATAEHDYQVRKNQIIKFLGEGHKVKAMIFHRGREMAHQEVGRTKMQRLLAEIAEHALVEIGPRMEANVLMALLAPKRGGAAPTKQAGAPAGGQA